MRWPPPAFSMAAARLFDGRHGPLERGSVQSFAVSDGAVIGEVEFGWRKDGECCCDFGLRFGLCLRCGSKPCRGERSEPGGHRQDLKAKEEMGESASHGCHDGRWYQE